MKQIHAFFSPDKYFPHSFLINLHNQGWRRHFWHQINLFLSPINFLRHCQHLRWSSLNLKTF